MIFRSLIPLIIVVLVMIVISAYTLTALRHSLSQSLYLEDGYLLTVNVLSQLNRSVVPMVYCGACMVINNPLNYTCDDLLINVTNSVGYALNFITNETGGTVRYRIISYGVWEVGNYTVIKITVDAYYGDYVVERSIIATIPIKLCTYVSEVKNLMKLNNASYIIRASNISNAQQAIDSLIKSSFHNSDYDFLISYMVIFRRYMIKDNETYYYGVLHYSITPLNMSLPNCDVKPGIYGTMNIYLTINGNLTNVYIFELRGSLVS